MSKNDFIFGRRLVTETHYSRDNWYDTRTARTGRHFIGSDEYVASAERYGYAYRTLATARVPYPYTSSSRNSYRYTYLTVTSRSFHTF